MSNLLMFNAKVGDIVKYGFKIVKIGRIQRGLPNGLLLGYDQYGQWTKIPFTEC